MSKQRINILPIVYLYAQYDTLSHITMYFVGYFSSVVYLFFCFMFCNYSFEYIAILESNLPLTGSDILSRSANESLSEGERRVSK